MPFFATFLFIVKTFFLNFHSYRGGRDPAGFNPREAGPAKNGVREGKGCFFFLMNLAQHFFFLSHFKKGNFCFFMQFVKKRKKGNFFLRIKRKPLLFCFFSRKNRWHFFD